MKQDNTFSDTMKELLEQKAVSKWDKLKKWLNSFTESFENLKGTKNSKKILIIDEIDVLFDISYYGNTYNLAVPLKGT